MNDEEPVVGLGHDGVVKERQHRYRLDRRKRLLQKPKNYLELKVKMQGKQVVIAQWLAQRLATGEVPGLNPGKGENY